MSMNVVSRSGGTLVLVDDAAEDVATDDRAAGIGGHRAGDRLGKLEAAVGPGLVVVAEILDKHGLEMSLPR